MHIEVNQATQSIAANVRRKIYPQELDWILNKVTNRYIGTHSAALRNAPGAAESMAHLNRLNTLISEYDLPAYQTERGVIAALPFSVQELLSVEVAVQNLCGNPATTLRADVPLQYLEVKETVALTEFYKTVVLTIDAQVVFSIQAHATARAAVFNGFTAKEETWRLVPLIMAELQAKGYEVYWEHYGSLYKPNTIIFASLNPSTINLNIDGVVTAGVLSEPRLVTRYTNTPTILYPGRLYFQTISPQTSQGAFSGTYYRSPLCVLRDGSLEVYLTSSFIVSSVTLHHIRRPRRIDLNLKESCELPENAHPDICDLATEYIKVLRSDPDWEAKLRDNMQRTTI